MSRPLLLDLFCGAGGAGVGYARAGFDVIGVDLAPMPRYPFEVWQADALVVLGNSRLMRQFDAVHSSPPCQRDCTLTLGTNAGRRDQYADLYEPVRRRLYALGLPAVIENPAARPDVVLCGEMYGLDVIRHRKFERVNWSAGNPVHVPHRGRVRGYRHGKWYDGPYVAAYGKGGGKASAAEMRQAMGIDWTDVHAELTEAIPPAYTQFIGGQLLEALDRSEVAAA